MTDFPCLCLPQGNLMQVIIQMFNFSICRSWFMPTLSTVASLMFQLGMSFFFNNWRVCVYSTCTQGRLWGWGERVASRFAGAYGGEPEYLWFWAQSGPLRIRCVQALMVEVGKVKKTSHRNSQTRWKWSASHSFLEHSCEHPQISKETRSADISRFASRLPGFKIATLCDITLWNGMKKLEITRKRKLLNTSMRRNLQWYNKLESRWKS